MLSRGLGGSRESIFHSESRGGRKEAVSPGANGSRDKKKRSGEREGDQAF